MGAPLTLPSWPLGYAFHLGSVGGEMDWWDWMLSLCGEPKAAIQSANTPDIFVVPPG